MARGEAFIGTSGFGYDEWRDGLYRGVPRRAWLRAYAERFGAVEINGSFYGTLSPATLRRWVEETPPGFVFTMKGHRYVTHRRRLLDPGPSVARQRESARPLGRKLRAVLWQLPGDLKRDDGRLDGFLRALRRWRVPHAIEMRHPSWFHADVADRLRDANVAACVSDAADWPLWDVDTANLAYLRLHGHTRTYASRYATRSLRRWATWARRRREEGREVHVYFDNTAEGHAPADALRLSALLGVRGGS